MRLILNTSGRPVRVPAAPAAAHLRYLFAEGMGWERVTRAAHCSSSTIHRILGGQQLVRRSVADRILAVKARPAPGRFTDATGTRRRVQALIAIGHTVGHVSDEAGVDQSVLIDIIGGSQTRARGITADRIAAAYDWLSHQPPTSERTSAISACRNRAARAGWPDPTWWEDMGHIDDPTFDPTTAERPLKRNELAALRRAEIEHLASYGYDADEIADRVNLGIKATREILLTIRTGQRRDRKQAA
ncbi:hypothetical protein ACH43Y_14255 [Streptomyces rubiginosohelvolus]|uniref:hypothetical protein n=1 Tax=Streptomyces TaxID=1883 RepID=UPI0036663183